MEGRAPTSVDRLGRRLPLIWHAPRSGASGSHLAKVSNMKNIIMVVVLEVALTAACLWYSLPNNQPPVFIGGSEVIGGSIHRVD